MTSVWQIRLKKFVLMTFVLFLISGGNALANTSKNYKAAVLIEANSGKVLYEYNKDKILGQASITKVMTYYIFRDFIEENSISQSTKVKINLPLNALYPDGGGIGLKNGDTITIKELNETLLVKSANDSALVIADFYKSRTKKDFVGEMNKKAKSLGMKNTYYINPHGLTDKKNNKYNYTTAYETALLVNSVIKKYPDSLKITSKKSCTYGNKTLKTTNNLLSTRPTVDGFKTGYTTISGYCLASTEDLTATNGSGKPFRLIAVVLGSSSSNLRDREIVNLLEYGKKNFMNNNFGGLAETKTLGNARAKISHLTKSLKTNYLGLKNQGTWEIYIKQARDLINKIPSLEKKERDSLIVEVNKSEALVKGLSRINQVEKSMEINAKVMRNVPTWEQYLELAKIDLAKVDQNTFSSEYKQLIDRSNICQEVVNSIKADNINGQTSLEKGAI